MQTLLHCYSIVILDKSSIAMETNNVAIILNSYDNNNFPPNSFPLKNRNISFLIHVSYKRKLILIIDISK